MTHHRLSHCLTRISTRIGCVAECTTPCDPVSPPTPHGHTRRHTNTTSLAYYSHILHHVATVVVSTPPETPRANAKAAATTTSPTQTEAQSPTHTHQLIWVLWDGRTTWSYSNIAPRNNNNSTESTLDAVGLGYGCWAQVVNTCSKEHAACPLLLASFLPDAWSAACVRHVHS